MTQLAPSGTANFKCLREGLTAHLSGIGFNYKTRDPGVFVNEAANTLKLMLFHIRQMRLNGRTGMWADLQGVLDLVQVDAQPAEERRRCMYKQRAPSAGGPDSGSHACSSADLTAGDPGNDDLAPPADADVAGPPSTGPPPPHELVGDHDVTPTPAQAVSTGADGMPPPPSAPDQHIGVHAGKRPLIGKQTQPTHEQLSAPQTSAAAKRAPEKSSEGPTAKKRILKVQASVISVASSMASVGLGSTDLEAEQAPPLPSARLGAHKLVAVMNRAVRKRPAGQAPASASSPTLAAPVAADGTCTAVVHVDANEPLDSQLKEPIDVMIQGALVYKVRWSSQGSRTSLYIFRRPDGTQAFQVSCKSGMRRAREVAQQLADELAAGTLTEADMWARREELLR